MENIRRTNRLAIASFASGLIALVIIGLVFLADPTSSQTNFRDGILLPLRGLAVLTALVTGVLALRELRAKEGAGKEKILAWFGIVVGAGWFFFRVLVGLVFILALFFH